MSKDNYQTILIVNDLEFGVINNQGACMATIFVKGVDEVMDHEFKIDPTSQADALGYGTFKKCANICLKAAQHEMVQTVNKKIEEEMIVLETTSN